jgi:ATP-dependent DNA helicase RecQ
VQVKGNLPQGDRAGEGRALARLTDLGWGGPLRELFAAGAPDAPVTKPMLDACVRVLAEWKWEQRPVGIVVVPSRSRPQLVNSIAEGIGRIGRLPILGALERTGDGGASGETGNSAYRLGSVWPAFRVGDELAAAVSSASGPVLLIDDLADSRWTLTVAARLLRQAGAPAVLPFVLALRS